jgi:hypothetical protein
MQCQFRLFSLIFTTVLLVVCSGGKQARAEYVPHPDTAGARIEFFARAAGDAGTVAGRRASVRPSGYVLQHRREGFRATAC